MLNSHLSEESSLNLWDTCYEFELRRSRFPKNVSDIQSDICNYRETFERLKITEQNLHLSNDIKMKNVLWRWGYIRKNKKESRRNKFRGKRREDRKPRGGETEWGTRVLYVRDLGIHLSYDMNCCITVYKN